jgi:hypothetical protein
MNEVHVPIEVLKQAEASEMQSRAEFVSSGEFLSKFIRRININNEPTGGNYGKIESAS